MSHSSSTSSSGRSWSDWFANLPTISLLLMILIISTGEMMHGQLLKIGEAMFSDKAQNIQYFLLRGDPEKPTCNPDVNIDDALTKEQAAGGLDGGKKDDIDNLFGDKKFDPVAARISMQATIKDCAARHEMYGRIKSHITPQLKVYRALETSFFTLFKFGADNRAITLLLLLTVTATFTTLGCHHIGLRPPRHQRDFKVQTWAMLICNLMMLYSSVRYYEISVASGIALDDPRVYFMWMILFGSQAIASVYRIFKMPERADKEPGGWINALECMPLIATMGIFTSVYFFFHNHPSGPVIYANKMLDFISLPLALALHIWAGMLFKQSRLVDLFMNIMRPWKLSPEALTYIILLAAGLPTAYAGVSSVFVIAAGAIVYHEVRAVGGTSQYALAATAMSGSLGVVLSPSLLVVGIAALNRQVTTAQLFHWGLYVFALTSTMFFIASQLHRHNRHQKAAVASPFVAIPAMIREMKAVVPFVLLIGGIAMFYSHVLDTPFNEISAPSILPIMMLVVLVFDKKMLARATLGRNFAAVGAAAVQPPAPTIAHVEPAYVAQRKEGAAAAVHAATTETVEHVGAYISLMLFTQLVGGMVERSEVMTMAPQHFPNVWLAMTFLVVAKVILGMVMEPLGAIILVSSTLAPLAYANGIEPVHFWMMVLVAFELGYLLPPVALNQLLTRQVVGEAEIDKSDAEVAGAGFYRRYERWILPCAVMSLSLAIVAYGPLMVQHFEVLKPIKDLFH